MKDTYIQEWGDVYAIDITKYNLTVYCSGAWESILRTVCDVALISPHVSI
jgi:hypothetical protein